MLCVRRDKRQAGSAGGRGKESEIQKKDIMPTTVYLRPDGRAHARWTLIDATDCTGRYDTAYIHTGTYRQTCTRYRRPAMRTYLYVRVPCSIPVQCYRIVTGRATDTSTVQPYSTRSLQVIG